ncbi:ankyrin repeat-containing protein NPR4 isoform X2 [Prunus yedoensis var. nudiflora]|uniref:Ankyrin repeat-containing protein NPR4 isoform X2 n=1 Tax=Prunus yedoensis var. nudiflora TaxID=2094558 RepID=A0A314YCW5_PRUYE|nr:ankyrin repeat-containing protein NPR4 isoform X2 [Prunus yedoensis var. nudiflora]
MTEVESAHETHGSFVSKATGHPLPPPDHGTPVIALFNSYRQPQNLQPIPAIPPKLGKWDQSAPAQVHTNAFTEVLRKVQQDATKILETPSKGVANNVPNSALTNTNLVPYVILHLAALSGDWDIARKFLQLKPQANPQIAFARDENGETPLHVMARKPSACYSGSQLGFWQRCKDSCE